MFRPFHSITILLLSVFLIGIGSHCLYAQVGGYAGSALRRPAATQEVSMAGIYTPWSPNVTALFSNSAALAYLQNTSASASFSLLGAPQQSGLLGIGTPVGEFGGIAAGLSSYGVADIQQRTFDERRLGTTSSQDFALWVGGGLAIGPGSVGATVRYLRYDLSGIEGGSAGYGVDLAGMLTFNERLFITVALNNIAGEMVATYSSGPRETIPFDARLGASYLYPFEERAERVRMDPSGLPKEKNEKPGTYALFALEGRISDIDSIPTIGVAIETIPAPEFTELGLGFRAGGNSLGDITGGLFFNLPVRSIPNLRLDLAARFGALDFIGTTYHTTLTVEF